MDVVFAYLVWLWELSSETGSIFCFITGIAGIRAGETRLVVIRETHSIIALETGPGGTEEL